VSDEPTGDFHELSNVSVGTPGSTYKVITTSQEVSNYFE